MSGSYHLFLPSLPWTLEAVDGEGKEEGEEKKRETSIGCGKVDVLMRFSWKLFGNIFLHLLFACRCSFSHFSHIASSSSPAILRP